MIAEVGRAVQKLPCLFLLQLPLTYNLLLLPSLHSLLRKPLQTEFPMWLSDHSQFMQHSVSAELLLSQELKRYLCCSSQACSSSQHPLVTLFSRYSAIFLNSIWLFCQKLLLICFFIKQTRTSCLFLQLSTSRYLLNILP